MDPIILSPVEWISDFATTVKAYQTTHGTTFLIDTKDLRIQITTSTCATTKGGNRIVLGSREWEGAIRDANCYGNTLYFRTDTMKMYKIQLSKHPKVEFVRDIGQEETRYKGMLFSRVRDGRTVVYRACDDPSNGIVVNAEEDALKRYYPAAIHKGKLIYKALLGKEKGGGFMARAITPNIIAIDSSENFDCDLYTTEEHALVYLLTAKKELTVLNPCTMDLLSYTLRERWMKPLARPDAPDLRFWDIVGVGKGGREGKLVVMGMDAKGHRLFAAEAPIGLTMMEFDAVKAEKNTTNTNKEEEEKKIDVHVNPASPIVPF